MDDALKQAILAIKSGNTIRGKQMLIQILEQDSKNELAWLWMSKCVTTKEQKIDCLRRALEINPHNEPAQQEIRRIMTLDSIKQSSESTPTPTSKTSPSSFPPKQTKNKNKPWLVYIVAGFLVILFGWQIISFVLSIVQSNENRTYEFVTIPEGEFVMGGKNSENAPEHKVFVDAFEIGKFEVTNAQYRECVLAKKCTYPSISMSQMDDIRFQDQAYGESKYANYPVVNINWMQARDFCKYIGARLPTEAQWEYAARGGLDRQDYPWGNETPVCDTSAKNGANFDGSNCPNKAMKVGSFSPNDYGLYDMFGNVAEWTLDWYDYYPVGDPNSSGDFGRQYKVMRGGSWSYTYFSYQSIDARYYALIINKEADIGVRCARPISE